MPHRLHGKYAWVRGTCIKVISRVGHGICKMVSYAVFLCFFCTNCWQGVKSVEIKLCLKLRLSSTQRLHHFTYLKSGDIFILLPKWCFFSLITGNSASSPVPGESQVLSVQPPSDNGNRVTLWRLTLEHSRLSFRHVDAGGRLPKILSKVWQKERGHKRWWRGRGTDSCYSKKPSSLLEEHEGCRRVVRETLLCEFGGTWSWR